MLTRITPCHVTSSNHLTSSELRQRHVTSDKSVTSHCVRRSEERCERRTLSEGVHCLVDISDSEDDAANIVGNNRVKSAVQCIIIIAHMMRWLWNRLSRWRTNIMLFCIVSLAVYMVFLDPYGAHGYLPEGALDLEELEQELEIGKPVRLVTYRSPVDDKIYAVPLANKSKYGRDYVFEAHLSRALRFNRLWSWADDVITHEELFPEQPEVDDVIDALQTAKFVSVDILNIGKYESGTSEKWLVTLEGGQKAMLKLVWEEKGKMKLDALCNYGYEMPSSEIAAFHLHRLLGFRNTPYVTGRIVDLRQDVLPVASPAVLKKLTQTSGNQTCVVGKCYFCKTETKLCPSNGRLEASLAYWIPRHLELYTFPPQYMPYSTPSMHEWGSIGFNNKSYCKKIRGIKPYEEDHYYYDLFDFAALDTLMYHFDSKHYVISDKSKAQGSTVRLDHGRAFCANDRDDKEIFMAPLTQCCTLRRSTYDRLHAQKGGVMTRHLRQRLARDPIAPILEDKWYSVLDHRLDMILDIMEQCAEANGGWQNVLVDT